MFTIVVPTLIVARSHLVGPLRRAHADQRGEGVISAAIAVLVMAFLGAAMWLAFDSVFTSTTDRTSDQVELIGS